MVIEAVPIQYREFYDVPRIFIATHRGRSYLFDGRFDDRLDDYPDQYRVFALPKLSAEELSGTWTDLRRRAIRDLGSVPVQEVRFDQTRRSSIDAEVLRRIDPGNEQPLVPTGTG